jgi:periplasmic protein TonB
MFEHVFVTNTGRTVRPYTVMVSFAGQMALVGLSILVPLIYTDTLPNGWLAQRFSTPLVPPGRPAVQPQPKPEPSVLRPRPGNAAGKFFEPVNYPPQARAIVDTEAPPAAWTDGNPNGVVGGTGGPEMGPLTRAIDDLTRHIPLPPTPVKPDARTAARDEIIRVRVGGLVKAPIALHTPQPAYPEMARRARVEGVVHLEAIVATNGTVQGVQLIQGHPLLVAAAIAAVREWRYTPPTLNGDPVEMVMFVDVIFRMGR